MRLELGKYYGCPYCGKAVRHKRFVGTLHICLLPDERKLVDAAKIRQQQVAIRQTRECFLSPENS